METLSLSKSETHLKKCGRGHFKTPDNTRKSGACRQCDLDYRLKNREALKAKNLEYYRKNRESFKAASRNNRLKNQYGIDQEWYLEQFAKQAGVCAICFRPQEEGIKSLAVDHDHHTKKLRGLLCRACNRGLGVFGDDVERLRSAIAYLEKYK